MHRPDAMAGSARAAPRATTARRRGPSWLSRSVRYPPATAAASAAHASAAAANPIARARRLMRRRPGAPRSAWHCRQARVSATLSRPVRKRQLEDRRPAAGRPWTRKRPPCAAAIEATTRRPWPRRGSRPAATLAAVRARGAAVGDRDPHAPARPIVASTQTRRPPCSIALAIRLSSACATRHGIRHRPSRPRPASAARASGGPRRQGRASARPPDSTRARQATGRRARRRADRR